ncbi:MAG: transcriptional regulator PpsR [Pseudomonadota bacterium]
MVAKKLLHPTSIATEFVAELDTPDIAQIVSSANDMALVIDGDGIVRDVTAEQGIENFGNATAWIGQPWADTVTIESRPKLEALMRTTSKETPSRWRQVNIASPSGQDIPLLFRVFNVDDDGNKIVMGRDLRALSSMQQELLDVQHSMEDDYARLYQAETRYRMLFQMSAEAILILDANGKNILEANPAASQLLDTPVNKLVTSSFNRYFVEKSASEISQLLTGVRATGKGTDLTVRTRKGNRFSLNATLLRQDDSTHFLLHLSSAQSTGKASQAPTGSSEVLEVIERSPDAFVVADPDGRIMAANEAFLELCQLASDLQIKNQPLEQWLGRPGVDVGLLRKNLQKRGVVRQYTTQIHPEFGAPVDVELSAVSALDAEVPCFGFIIRRTLRRHQRSQDIARQPFGQSLEQMTELVGRVPLKDLVRETTDLIERLCVEAALKLTSNNRASAADMLGLSRQSLYVKLRRYGIGDQDSLQDQDDS